MREYLRKQLSTYIWVAIGCIIMSASINTFFIPHNLLSGGVSGLAMIIYFLTTFPLGVTSILLNIPLFYLAYRYIDTNYCLSGIFGMIVFSLALDATSFLKNAQVMDDIFLSCIYGGLFSGIGASMLYRVNAHSGGTDILGGIVNKYYGLNVATVGFGFNCMLMVIAASLFGLKPAMYTLISMFITSVVANKFTEGFDYKKSIMIISAEPENIATGITKELGRGVTYLFGEGAYTKQNRKVIFVVVKLRQVSLVKAIVTQTDPHAFMIITDVTDVIGKGFSLPIKK